MNKKPFGDQIEPWFKNLLGLRVREAALTNWMDFSNPDQVIFTYSVRIGTYAYIFPSQADSPYSQGMKVFVFLEVKNNVISGLSYSVIDINLEGAGEKMGMPVFEPDRAVIDNLLALTIDPIDYEKLKEVIDNRLRKMNFDELVKVKAFFTQVYNDKVMQEKYGKIVNERMSKKP